VFPEVRVKRTIEIRGADCVPVPLAVAFCALWRTLLYEQRAMDRATALSVEFCRHGTPEERFRTAVQSGLRGMVGGRSLASWAEDLVDAAEAGVPATRPDDLRYLQPLARQVERGESPARSLVRALRREGGDARAVLALARTEAERVTMPEAGAALAPSPLRTGLKGARAIDRISVLARTALPRIEGPEADETRVTLRKLLERLDAALATGLHTGLPTERWSQLRTALQPLEDALDQVNDDEPPDWNRVSTVARSALSSLRN
jgi:hypothetical protein